MANVSRVLSAELEGVDARLIEVETDIYVGLHSFTIVGLADKALSEAKERVNAALKNSEIKPPSQENRKIVVNLAPADLQKTGSQYDLPIALGYLLASGQMREFKTDDKLFIGELSLSGAVRSVPGVLNIARLALAKGIGHLFVPEANAAEAALVEGVEVTPVRDMKQLIAHLEGRALITPQPPTHVQATVYSGVDISDVRAQEAAKRALLVAAAGGHNVLMIGPPGTGKTMLAQALNSLLPPLSRSEVIETTQIYSSAGLLGGAPYVSQRPFRSPHQSASPVSVMGGGSSPRPGEISLAHHGILFLDETPEFRRDLLESLRQPLESGKAVITRVKSHLVFPARFMLVFAMNPCPCGYYGDEQRSCSCTANDILRYQKKISGPLLDRIDIQITVPRVTVEKLRTSGSLSSEGDVLRDKVRTVRDIQHKRFGGLNAHLPAKRAQNDIKLTPSAEQFIRDVMDKSLLSARGYYRVLKTARTIADLEQSVQVDKAHLAEAFSYRLKEGI